MRGQQFVDNRAEIMSRLRYWVNELEGYWDVDKVRAQGVEFGSDAHLLHMKSISNRIRLLIKILENLDKNSS